MTLADALEKLHAGGTWPELAEAVGTVIESPQATVFDIVQGLRHGGLVSEQAALALYSRTGRPIPKNRGELDVDFDAWLDWLTAPGSSKWRDRAPDLGDQSIGTRFMASAVSSGLSREQRLVLILYYLEGMTRAEIGSVLNMSEDQVNQIHQDTLHAIRSRCSAEDTRLLRDLVA